MNRRIIAILVSIIYSCALQSQDTLRVITLEGFEVIDSTLKNYNQQTSSHKIEKENLKKLSVYDIGQAAKFLPGVTIKDYGGANGLKTISVRGLGSMHTNLLYDGVSVSNSQNGQIDLSKFSVNNIEELSLDNGNRIMNMQTARSLASGSVLSLTTTQPSFSDESKTNGDISLSYGSFNLFNINANINKKINDKLIFNINSEFVNYEGSYPYTLHYGDRINDSTSIERRENNDLLSAKIESNIYANFSKKSSLKTKLYFYYDAKGLPGPTTLYYLNSAQRLWNKDLFLQSVFTHHFSDNLSYKTHLKISSNHTRYLDPYYNNSQGFQEDIYNQKELYYNNILAWQNKNKNICFSLTNDLSLNSLKAKNNYEFDPLRFSSLSAITSAFKHKKIRLDFNLLHTYTKDWATLHKTFESQSHFSPFVSLLLKDNCYEVSIFYKDIFRIPTFNDLYYNIVGEPNLKPEKAQQYNLHAAYFKQFGSLNYHNIYLGIDLYHNNVTDKIVAVPRNNLFVWSMVNYGQVVIDGLELKLNYTSERFVNQENIKININTIYNFQKAIDSDKNSNTYLHQIQYTPRHSGSVIASISLKKLSFAYTLSAVGKRYTMNQNTERNSLPAYCEHSLSLSKTIKQWEVKLSCNNLTNEQYEIIKSYPMCGRNYNLSIKYKF
jgi:outer membrane cobalamin receptor